MSRPVPKFAAHVDEAGQLVFDDYAAFSRQVARYKHCRVSVTVRQASSVRTMPQNRRLWMLYQMISDWCGHDPQEIHEAMKSKFLPWRTLEVSKGTIDIPPTTRLLAIEDFAAYMDRLESWMAEQGCPAPDRDKVE